jgi:hypothetical protein
VFIGNHHTQVNVTNKKGDIDGLLAELERNGIPRQQLDELETAIKADQEEGKEISVANEGKTSKWYTKTLKDAGKGIYKAGVDLTSQLIIKAFEHFSKGG